MQKVLLSSGGMDSFLLARLPELRSAVHLFVNVGQKYVAKERAASLTVAKQAGAHWVEMQTANLSGFEHSSGIIPFRNAEMILCAAQHGTEIYLGVIADEINSDKSVEFCDAMRRVLNISHKKQYWTEGKEYNINTPFRMLSKSMLVKQYLGSGGSLLELLQSVSCYDGGDAHCGRCASCFKRWVALVNGTEQNHWHDWGFAQNPQYWKTTEQWLVAMEGYSFTRENEILLAFAILQPI